MCVQITLLDLVPPRLHCSSVDSQFFLCIKSSLDLQNCVPRFLYSILTSFSALNGSSE